VRATAEKWIAGVAALYGLFSLSGAVVAKDSITALSTLPKWIVGVLALGALIAAIVSIFSSYRAAYGWPTLTDIETDTGLLRWYAHQQKRLPEAVALLHRSVMAAIATLILLAGALGVIWLWPTSPVSLVSVTYNLQGNVDNEVSVCGQLTDLDASEVSLTIAAGPSAGTDTLPVAWIVSTTPVSSC
jgi:hypothetical protein